MKTFDQKNSEIVALDLESWAEMRDDSSICLDGDFTVEELKSIIEIMESA